MAEAGTLFASGQYMATVVACKRTVFFNRDAVLNAKACLLEVEAYKMMGAFEKGEKRAQTFIFPFQLEKSYRWEIRYQAALCAYMAGNNDDVQMLLMFLDNEKPDSAFMVKTYLLRSLFSLEKNAVEDSQMWLEKLVNAKVSGEEKDLLLNKVAELYTGKNRVRIKNKEAGFWWGLVPGVGHFYAGAYKEGLTSFVLNAASLAFGVWQVYNGFYLTGYFGSTGLLVKFYYGSHDHKDYLIEKRNFEEIQSFKNKVGAILDKIE